MNPNDVFPSLVDLIERWKRALRRQESAPSLEAVEALGTALRQTQAYLEHMESVGRDRERENALAALWQYASQVLEREDSDLAQTAARKMDYWRHPEIWTEQEIAAAGIGIDRVMCHYTDLRARLV